MSKIENNLKKNDAVESPTPDPEEEQDTGSGKQQQQQNQQQERKHQAAVGGQASAKKQPLLKKIEAKKENASPAKKMNAERAANDNPEKPASVEGKSGTGVEQAGGENAGQAAGKGNEVETPEKHEAIQHDIAADADANNGESGKEKKTAADGKRADEAKVDAYTREVKDLLGGQQIVAGNRVAPPGEMQRRQDAMRKELIKEQMKREREKSIPWWRHHW